MQPAVPELVDDVHRVRGPAPRRASARGRDGRGRRRPTTVDAHQTAPHRTRPPAATIAIGSQSSRSSGERAARSAASAPPAEIIPRTTIVRESDPLGGERQEKRDEDRRRGSRRTTRRAPGRSGAASRVTRRSSAPGRKQHAGRGRGEPQAEPGTLRGKEPARHRAMRARAGRPPRNRERHGGQPEPRRPRARSPKPRVGLLGELAGRQADAAALRERPR